VPEILTVVAPAAFKLARVLVEVLDTTDKVVGTAPRSTEPVVVTPFSVRVSDVATGVTNEPLVWVKDVPLSPIGGRFNHTSYWFKDSNSKHLQALSESLQMDAKKDLISLLQCLPPSLFLQNNKVR
jgi:hypothetical protein